MVKDRSTNSAFRIAILCISLLMAKNAVAIQNVRANVDTRELLTELKSIKSDREVLAILFKSGDARISDLIEALDDRDRQISLRAQIVIRYLGNDTGMKALESRYKNQSEIVIAGPVPLPLGERDYEFIKDQYIDKPSIKWVSDKYIYALALDGSARAKNSLNEMMKRAGSIDDSTEGGRALGRVFASTPRKLLTPQPDLAKMVLANAFFILPSDRAYTSSRLLTVNAAKDKALVEVYINRGPLAEEWYHVVVSKQGRNWKFFSITQVAVS
jgi:hypothetical protein